MVLPAVVLRELGLLDLPLLGGDHQVLRRLVISHVDDGFDRLVGLKRHHRLRQHALGRAVLARQLVGLDPVDPTPVGKEEQI